MVHTNIWLLIKEAGETTFGLSNANLKSQYWPLYPTEKFFSFFGNYGKVFTDWENIHPCFKIKSSFAG